MNLAKIKRDKDVKQLKQNKQRLVENFTILHQNNIQPTAASLRVNMYATTNLSEGTKGNLPIVRGKKNNLSVSGAGSANGESTFNRFPSRMTGSFNPNVNSPLFHSQYGTQKQSLPTSTKNAKK